MKKLWLLALLTLLMVIPTLPVYATNPPTGLTFDHVIVIAMENQNYADVIGSSSAPFITSLANMGSAMSNYNSYAQSIGPSGCSAACYQAVTSGVSTVGDGWCDSNPPCPSTDGSSDTNNIANQLSASGLSSAMFCEDSCPRHADHFPWLGYSNTYNSCITTNSYTVNCSGQSGSAGDRLYNTVDALCTGSCATCSSSCTAGTAYTSFQSNAGNSAFINYLNGPNPANYIFFTPTDCHNMHDSCGQASKVRNGDYYIGSLLCGCSAWNSTAIALSGTVFAGSLWTSGRTILMLWWDEYSISPQVVIGSGIRSNFVSNTFYDEYYTLHTVERNWGISYINSVVAGDTSLTDIFVPALVATGPGSIVACSQCTMNVQYTMYTVDNSGTSTYSSNAPSQGPTPWSPSSGSKTMALDDQLTVTLTFGGSNYYCNTGQFTSMFTVNGVQRQLSTHINCAIAPGH